MGNNPVGGGAPLVMAPAIYYPNLAGESQSVQDAVKRAYDNIYALRAQLAAVVQAHNELINTVSNQSTAAQKTQLQIALVNAIP